MVIYDECDMLSIYELMNAGCFRESGTSTFVISWSSEITTLQMHLEGEHPFITVSHGSNIQAAYKVQLATTPFHMNSGVLWYFICPVTGVRCKKLLYHNGRLLHRSALIGFYQKQVDTSAHRKFTNHISAIKKLSRMSDKVKGPWFRPTYAGAPTKAYLRILDIHTKAIAKERGA